MYKIQNIFQLYIILAKKGEGERKGGEIKRKNAVSCNRKLVSTVSKINKVRNDNNNNNFILL